MRLNHFSGVSKFAAGVVAGTVLFSGPAIAINKYVSDNSAKKGYLLCANNKTKAVTFPNKLSCPSGTKALDMGAATGIEGAQGPRGLRGPEGPEGPAGSGGSEKNYWFVSSSSVDIYADGTIGDYDSMTKEIMYTLDSSDVDPGYYQLSANLSGYFADYAETGSRLHCYFQNSTDYYSDGGRQWGGAATDLNYWNRIQLNVTGDWDSEEVSEMYLVCRTSGTVEGLNFYLTATTNTMTDYEELP
jgi:hypothetical protein